MSDRIASTVKYIDQRLASMARFPKTWGSGQSLEFQALLLLEIRTFLLRPRIYKTYPFEARDEHIAFVRTHFPQSPNSFLSSLIPPERVAAELPPLIGEFQEGAIAKLGPEDPFEHYPLTIELCFDGRKKGVSFAYVCRYFLRFHKALNSVLRPDGRARLQIFWVPEVRVLSADDSGPRVRLLFDAPRVRRATRPQVFEALQRLLAIAAWSSGADGDFPEAGAELWQVAKRTLRLFPSGRITTVRIGGIGLEQPPMELRAANAQRLRERVLAHDFERRVFGASAEMMGMERIAQQGGLPLRLSPPRFAAMAEA